MFDNLCSIRSIKERRQCRTDINAAG